jgi:protein ImuB
MRIPSYDDLTPSIPDVSTGEVHEAVARLLPESGLVAVSSSTQHVARADDGRRTTDDGRRTTDDGRRTTDDGDPASLRSPRQDSAVYACLRSVRHPDAILAIAREFSPRIQRYPEAVVLDVSGLGRLLGPPATIGVELAQSVLQHIPLDSDSPQPRRSVDRQVPRYVSRYGLRIEPHPSEHGRVCATAAIDDEATAVGIDAEEKEAGRAIESAGISIAIAPTHVGALLLTLDAHPLTIAGLESSGTRSLTARLERLPLRVLQQFLAGVHGATLLRGRKRAKPSVPPSKTSRWPSWTGCEHTFDVLHRWGLRTFGELTALPSAELSARAGQDGVALQRLARGIDPGPLIPDPDVPRYLQRMELEWPIDGLEPLSFVLARMLDPLSAALEQADRAAAAIRLDLRLVDRTTHSRQLQLPVAMRDPRVLRTLLLLDLESHPPHAAIDIVTIEADPAPGRVVQYSLLDRALPSAETLATLTARLHALVGESRCGTPVLLDTHRPDAFRMERLSTPPVIRASLETEPALSEGQRPSRVEGSEGQGPSRVEGAGTRRFRPPVAVRVRVERGRPVHLAIDRRGMPGGAIVQAAGPWRSSGDWWIGPTPWDHDEWDVELSDGVVCRLFRERESGAWFLDGVVD